MISTQTQHYTTAEKVKRDAMDWPGRRETGQPIVGAASYICKHQSVVGVVTVNRMAGIRRSWD